MITREQIETRFEKVLGNFGKCEINWDMENTLRKFVNEISRELIELTQSGIEPEINLKDLEEIATNYFYEDYLVVFKNKRKAKARAKERVKTIIEDELKNIQR